VNRPIFAALILFLLVAAYSWKGLFAPIPEAQMWDRTYYLRLAEGDTADVIRPFTKRILHPKAARFLSDVTGWEIRDSFRILSFLSLFLISISLAVLWKKLTPFPSLGLLPVVFTPYLCQIFSDFLMHDLFFSALLSLFFLLLAFGRDWLSLPLLFLLFLTREATVLLAVFLGALSLYRRRFLFAVGLFAVLVAGFIASSHFASLGQPNKHQMGEALYMFSKVVYNFSANFLGINFWVNTYDHCVPFVEGQVPPWLPAGMIHFFGVCGFSIWQPVNTLVSYLTIFGIGPAALAFVLIRKRFSLFREGDLPLLLFLAYGLVSYLLGPFLGPGGYRLMGYGWPAFWLATPVLAGRYLSLDKKGSIRLVICHLILSWLPPLVALLHLSWGWDRTLLAVTAIPLQIYSLKTVRQSFAVRST
jgi:hypothetical protein